MSTTDFKESIGVESFKNHFKKHHWLQMIMNLSLRFGQQSNKLKDIVSNFWPYYAADPISHEWIVSVKM